MKIRCLLVDDEPPALKVLQAHIAQMNTLEVVGSCGNAVEAMEVLHKKTVDVIFLDIKMPKIIGTEFLRNLSHPPKVIFVTAYRDYAVEAFELDAVDYLVKPISFERFLKAIHRLNRTTDSDIENGRKSYDANPDAFIYLKVDRVMHKILINEILYIESWKDYVKLYLTNGKFLLVKQPISTMMNLLSDHKFLRIHRSYIVSINKITGFNSLVIKLGATEIPLGRLYKQNVIEQLTASMRE